MAGILIPRQELTGGRDALVERVRKDPAGRARLVEGIRRSIELEGGADRIRFRSVSRAPELEGRTLAEGMTYVLVNGRFPVRDGAFTDIRSGLVLDRDPTPAG